MVQHLATVLKTLEADVQCPGNPSLPNKKERLFRCCTGEKEKKVLVFFFFLCVCVVLTIFLLCFFDLMGVFDCFAGWRYVCMLGQVVSGSDGIAICR